MKIKDIDNDDTTDRENISNVDKTKFENFMTLMMKGIDDHMHIYGISWKKEDEELLGDELLKIRLDGKLHEYTLTDNPKKLISLANLAMLLYCKKVYKDD